MKAFNKSLVILLLGIFVIFLGSNLYLKNIKQSKSRPYQVEIERAAAQIAEKGSDNLDLSEFNQLTNIVSLTGQKEKEFFEGNQSDYAIRKIGHTYYRMDYIANMSEQMESIAVSINIILGIMAAIMIVFMIFIRVRILTPFHQLTNIPYELSKGNLATPLKEYKTRFFGRFIWGLNLLRENIEEQRARELQLQKEKKTLILSISHEIKTPLSAIKLYAKALSKNIYKDPKKQIEIAENINIKTDEIENFVCEIIKASNEEFINLEVKEGEYYLSVIINQIKEFYQDKLKLLKIDFQIEKYSDCLLKGDVDRAVQVFQNIIENAIKYGNGHFVYIEFTAEEDCQLITVKNTGCTLLDNEVPHIFDSFWRGSNVEKKSGSGLGLYICRQLMIRMRGDIFAYSREGMMEVTVVFRRA